MYATEYYEEHRRQVAVNHSYICYSLRQGHVRILNKKSASKALQRASTMPVTDLRFYSDEVNLIASCSKDRSVHIFWISVAEENAPEQSTEMRIDPVASFRVDETEASSTVMTLSWHPQTQDVLAFTAGRHVAVCDLTGKQGDETMVAFPVEGRSDIASLDAGSDITNSAFSPSGTMLAAGGLDGQVRIWRLSESTSAGDIVGGLRADPLPFGTFFPYAEGAATRVAWIPAKQSVGGEVLLTGGPVERALRLWRVDPEGGAELIQELLLDAPAGESAFFNHVHIKPELQLIIVANTKASSVSTVHYSLSDDPEWPVRMRFIKTFAVTKPILSMTATWNLPIADGAPETIQLYCVQEHAVQQYTLHPEVCCPPEAEGEGEEEAEEASDAQPRLPSWLERIPPNMRRGIRSDFGDSEVDAGDFASSAGFATAGSVMDPNDLPEPDTPAGPEDTEGSQRPDSDGLDGSQDDEPAQGATDSASVEAADRTNGAGTDDSDVVDDASSPARDPGQPEDAVKRLLTPKELMSASRRPAEAEDFQPAPSIESTALPDAGPKSAPASVRSNVAGFVQASSAADESADADSAPGQNGPPKSAAASCSDHAPPADVPLPPPFAPTRAFLDTMHPETGAAMPPEEAHPKPLAAAGASPVDAATGGLDSRMTEMENRIQEAMDRKLADMLKTLQAAQEEQLIREQDSTRQMMEGLGKSLNDGIRKMQGNLSVTVDSLAAKREQAMVARVSEACAASVKASLGPLLEKQLPAAIVGPAQSTLQKGIAKQLVPAVQKSVQEAVQNCFEASLIPSVQAAINTILKQLDKTFADGLRHHAQVATDAATKAAAASRAPEVPLETFRAELTGLEARLRESLQSSLTVALSRLPASTGPSSATLTTLAEIEAAQNPETRLTRLIKSQNYEQAFDDALSMQHLPTVVWLCSQLKPQLVMGQGAAEAHRISPQLCLILIQQLSSDLRQDRELKLSWIMEACMSVDSRDQSLAGYMDKIFSGLIARIHEMLAGPHTDGEGQTARLIVHLAGMSLRRK